LSGSARGPLAVAGALLLASAVPAVPFYMDSRPFREVAGGPVHLSLYAISLAAMLALLVVVSRFAAARSSTGKGLPQWLTVLLLASTSLNAATHYVQVFVTPELANVAPAALDNAGGMLMYAMVGTWLLFLVAWVTFGVVAFRNRLLPRTSAVMVIASALLQPVIGPLVGLPFGIALLLGARSASRTDHRLVEPAVASSASVGSTV